MFWIIFCLSKVFVSEPICFCSGTQLHIVIFLKMRAQGEWEGSTLDLVLSAMQAFPDAAFLGLFSFNRFLYTCFLSDIGSNIGSYSVAVAGLQPAREVILPQFCNFLPHSNSKLICVASFAISCPPGNCR